MLINASKQREVANAVNSAKAEQRFLDTVKLVDKVIPLIRKRFEEAISEAALKGGTSYRTTIGLEDTARYGILSSILEKELMDEQGRTPLLYNWLRRGNDRCSKYKWEAWERMCNELVADLEANGYGIQVMHKRHPYSANYKSECLDPIPEVLVDHTIEITW